MYKMSKELFFECGRGYGKISVVLCGDTEKDMLEVETYVLEHMVYDETYLESVPGASEEAKENVKKIWKLKKEDLDKNFLRKINIIDDKIHDIGNKQRLLGLYEHKGLDSKIEKLKKEREIYKEKLNTIKKMDYENFDEGKRKTWDFFTKDEDGLFFTELYFFESGNGWWCDKSLTINIKTSTIEDMVKTQAYHAIPYVFYNHLDDLAHKSYIYINKFHAIRKEIEKYEKYIQSCNIIINDLKYDRYKLNDDIKDAIQQKISQCESEIQQYNDKIKELKEKYNEYKELNFNLVDEDEVCYVEYLDST